MVWVSVLVAIWLVASEIHGLRTDVKAVKATVDEVRNTVSKLSLQNEWDHATPVPGSSAGP